MAGTGPFADGRTRRRLTGGRVRSPGVSQPHPPTGSALIRDIALYTLARLAMIAALTGLLVLAGVPLLIALLLALVVALPLSLVTLRGLRARMNAGLRAAGAQRRAERERLRAQLRGEQPPEQGRS